MTLDAAKKFQNTEIQETLTLYLQVDLCLCLITVYMRV